MLLTPTLYNIKNPKNGAMLCLVAQLYPTLCQPMDCSPPGSSVHGDSPGHNTGLGCHALLHRIFPTQGSNQVSCIAGWFFLSAELPRKPQNWRHYLNPGLSKLLYPWSHNCGFRKSNTLFMSRKPQTQYVITCHFTQWKRLVASTTSTPQVLKKRSAHSQTSQNLKVCSSNTLKVHKMELLPHEKITSDQTTKETAFF